jgi:hypothetical protein
MVHPEVVDGDGLQIWRAVVSIMNKQSKMASKGMFSSLGTEHILCYKMFMQEMRGKCQFNLRKKLMRIGGGWNWLRTMSTGRLSY